MFVSFYLFSGFGGFCFSNIMYMVCLIWRWHTRKSVTAGHPGTPFNSHAWNTSYGLESKLDFVSQYKNTYLQEGNKLRKSFPSIHLVWVHDTYYIFIQHIIWKSPIVIERNNQSVERKHQNILWFKEIYPDLLSLFFRVMVMQLKILSLHN